MCKLIRDYLGYQERTKDLKEVGNPEPEKEGMGIHQVESLLRNTKLGLIVDPWRLFSWKLPTVCQGWINISPPLQGKKVKLYLITLLDFVTSGIGK